MDSNSIIVSFKEREALIKKNAYFSKFIEDIQRTFNISNIVLNDYLILAKVEYNDKKTKEYQIYNDTSYRNVILGNFYVNYVKIKKKTETQKNTYINKNSNSSINNNSNKKKINNENSSSNELSNNKMNIDLKKYVDNELNKFKNELVAVKNDIKTIFKLLNEIQKNFDYHISNHYNTTSASSTPSYTNSTKRVNNNNNNNNYNNNINNNNFNNNNITINENSNSSKGISKSIIYNNSIKNQNNNINEFNINKNQNFNPYNSFLPNKNINKITNYKVDFFLNKNKFPVIIKTQLNSNNYRNLEIKIKNTGNDLPAKCKIKSINQSFMKIEPTYINNGKLIKNNETINVNLNIKFENIKTIKQGDYEIQICLFNEFNKEINITCEEKITVRIIDSETNIVANKSNNKNNNYNNNLINDEVSNFNLFNNRNMNYINNYAGYNNNINKNVSGSYKASNNNVYMNNRRTNY